MDITDILKNLGVDLSDPEAKRGAIEAINAIISSRTKLPPLSGNSTGKGRKTPKKIDIEIDPDLIQPSQKHRAPTNDDIEINDDDESLSGEHLTRHYNEYMQQLREREMVNNNEIVSLIFHPLL